MVCRRPGQGRYPGTTEESSTYLSGDWGGHLPFETSRRCLTWAGMLSLPFQLDLSQPCHLLLKATGLVLFVRIPKPGWRPLTQ